VLIVDRNYGHQAVQSTNYYTHFSLLKTVETALGLPLPQPRLRASTPLMSDLFGLGSGRY